MPSNDLEQIMRNVSRLKDVTQQSQRLLRDIRQELINMGGDAYYFGDTPNPQTVGSLIARITEWLDKHEQEELQA
jgi:hypothetical protein